VRIRAIALDVDGVLTDGGFWLLAGQEPAKRFCFADVMGISLGRKAGLRFALVSGEAGAVLDQFAAKVQIADVYAGCKDKGAALSDFAGRHGLSLDEICFMGDDVNDLPAMALAGLAAAPASAQPAVRQRAALVTQHGGGDGAVRELIDLLLSQRLAGDTGRTSIPAAENAGGQTAPGVLRNEIAGPPS
jgi:3-deoxy-D-manno-octulosonate 8-phosphate phosphatase (KDO 8-P phosphatase)